MPRSRQVQEPDGDIWLFCVAAVVLAVGSLCYLVYLTVFDDDDSSSSTSVPTSITEPVPEAPPITTTYSEPSLYGSDDGYAWNKASNNAKLGLCMNMAKRATDMGAVDVSADFLYVELQEFYNSSESAILSESISDVAALIIKASQ